MTGKFGLTLGRLAKGLVAVFVLAIASTGLAAQETAGKIQGTVLDPNGQPVAGAQVFVVGSSQATQTDASGFYFLNNVPPGNYSLRAQFIGLQPARVDNVRVSGGQTITVAFDLAGAVALQAISITVAETPIVPRDQVRSRSIITGSDVDELPVSDPMDIVLLQPGVIEARGGAVSIRGGRAREAAIFIDGAPVRSSRHAGTNLSIATNAVEEVAVTTGAMSAEFGDAQSGVISFVTRAGGPNFAASFAYETDEMAGNRSSGLNRFEGSLSGPLVGNLTFFVGGSLQGESGFDGRWGAGSVARYVPGGVDTEVTIDRTGENTALVEIPTFIQYSGDCAECQGARIQNRWTTEARFSGKLQFTFGSGSRMALSAHRDLDQDVTSDMLGLEALDGNRANSELYVFNWVQQVFRGATSELSFDINLSYQSDFVNTGQVERSWDLDHRDPGLGIVIDNIPFVFNPDNFSYDTGADAITTLNSDADWDTLIDHIRRGPTSGTVRPILDRLETSRFPTPRLNPFAVSGGFNNTGVAYGFQLSDEVRTVGRVNVDWQAGRYNRFRFGGEVRSTRTNHFDVGTAINRFSFGNIYTAEPTQSSVYIQDRLDLGDVVIDFGIRWDQYASNGLFPIVPGRIFTHPDFDDANPLSTVIWKEGETHNAVSPRLGVSFPVTDQTGFRLSYAHQAQSPRFQDIFGGINVDLSTTNTNQRFGGDVGFAKTIMFEFGVRHAFNQDMVIDIAAYNKDKVSDHTYRTLPFFDPFFNRVNNVNVLTSADFGTVRGIEFTFQRRFSNIFSLATNYTFQNSKSTGSDPTDFLNGLSRQPFDIEGNRPAPPQTTLRTRDDRRHNIAGQFTVAFPRDHSVGLLRNVGIYGTYQLQSGLPYTRVLNIGAGARSNGALGATLAAEPLQASETPWTKNFDIRVTKGFEMGGTSWSLYLDVRNLFNFKNRNVVFSETGDIVNELRFRNAFFEPQVAIMRNEAIASGWETTVIIDGVEVEAIDLGDGSVTGNMCDGWAGAGGALSCYMLKAAEARFGNGDGIYDITEQEAAIRGWYNLGNGEHTFLGDARAIRVGMQLDF